MGSVLCNLATTSYLRAIVSLAHFCTVFRNVYCTAPGIQDNVLEELKSKSLSLASHERFLVISIDEMKGETFLGIFNTINHTV